MRRDLTQFNGFDGSEEIFSEFGVLSKDVDGHKVHE